MKRLHFSQLQVLEHHGSAMAIAQDVVAVWFCVWTCAGFCHLQLLSLSRLCKEEVVAGADRTKSAAVLCLSPLGFSFSCPSVIVMGLWGPAT